MKWSIKIYTDDWLTETINSYDLQALKTLFNIVEERLKKLLNLDVCVV